MENITIPDAQADENYQRTVGDLARARADFTAQQGLARNQYDFGWNDAKRRMGWDDTAGKFDRSRPGAYGESVTADEGDFAGRGMLHSGLYLNSLGDIDRDFGDRKSSLDTARNDNVNTQGQALSTFSGSQDATKQSALTDAVSRIASKYGIDLGAVPKGTGPTTIQRQVV
jgi:pyruvate/2-oxoglutarate dehydrogenase complex dihydrolipoamide acyltransferase (E2) component